MRQGLKRPGCAAGKTEAQRTLRILRSRHEKPGHNPGPAFGHKKNLQKYVLQAFECYSCEPYWIRTSDPYPVKVVL